MSLPIKSGARSISSRKGTQRGKRRASWVAKLQRLEHINRRQSGSLGNKVDSLTHIVECERCASLTCIEPALRRCMVCGCRRFTANTPRALWMQWICDAQCSAHLTYAAIAFRDKRGARAGNTLIEGGVSVPPWFVYYALGPNRSDPESADVIAAQLRRG